MAFFTPCDWIKGNTRPRGPCIRRPRAHRVTVRPAFPAPPLTPSSCHPVSNGGNCNEPGEFCRNRDHGATGVAGDGENIVCMNNNGWRWEPST